MATPVAPDEPWPDASLETLERDRSAGRALAWLGAVLLPLWTPFDWIFTPERWMTFALLRLGCSVCLIGFALALSRASTLRSVYVLTFLSMGTMAGVVAWMMAVVEDDFLPYLVGFSLILWGGGQALSYPVKRMAALQLMLLAIVAGMQALYADRRTTEDMVFAATFLVTSATLCTAFSALRLASLSQVLEARMALSRAQVQMAEERASNQAKSAFLARMSHELRTPLTAILGYSELIGEELAEAGVELVSDDLDRIRGASNHLLALIDDILDLSRIEAGELAIEVRTVALAPMIDEVVAELWSLAARKNIRLQAELAPDLGELNTDPVRARQIVVNLVTNAIKFTDQGGVLLTANRTTEGVRFEVRDSGVGIADHDLDRVFEPFVQVDGTTTRRKGGSGLGLAIVRDLAGLLGGRVSVASVPGVGSTFIVELVDLPAPQGA